MAERYEGTRTITEHRVAALVGWWEEQIRRHQRKAAEFADGRAHYTGMAEAFGLALADLERAINEMPAEEDAPDHDDCDRHPCESCIDSGISAAEAMEDR